MANCHASLRGMDTTHLSRVQPAVRQNQAALCNSLIQLPPTRPAKWGGCLSLHCKQLDKPSVALSGSRSCADFQPPVRRRGSNWQQVTSARFQSTFLQLCWKRFHRSNHKTRQKRHCKKVQASFNWRYSDEEEECDENGICTPAQLASFEEGRRLYNQQEFYKCHDVLEELWHVSPEPQRSVLHGILQSAVGLYHLLNQNHRGALIQFGEGLHKLRRQRLQEGPLLEFEQGMSALQEFVYSTQLEHAACDEESCVPMTGDDESYRLLGDFGAGQPMYTIQEGQNGCKYIQFSTARQKTLLAQGSEQQRVLIPLLEVTEADLLELSKR